MLLGTFAPRLDDKGRLFLPAKFRDELAAGVVITPGQERCLYVFPRAEFDRITGRLSEIPLTAKAVREWTRVFFTTADDQTPDRQGRIGVAANLRSFAGLDRDLAVVGMNTRLEIWDSAAWETDRERRENDFASVSEEVLPGVL